MSLATAPAPARQVSPSRVPIRHVSPLNPNSCRSLRTTISTTSTTNTKIHLSNLDKVLLKPTVPQHQTLESNYNTATTMATSKESSQDAQPTLLNALNLPSFLPFIRKPALSDEMSPRSLTHLQRLLSESPRPSPRNSIASQWRLYHGQAGWAGLLDPLDENLRRELLRYGDFVQSAYHAFHSLPSAPSRNRNLLLPDRSYRLTRNLFATSSLSIPDWARRPETSPWLTQRSNWIGFVAVCDSEREIARMGRRDITIVLRGTATCLEWAENLRASLVPIEGEQEADAAAQEAKVARGFLSLYKTEGEKVPSLSKAVVDEVKRLMEIYKEEELSITVVGHSLGAALALLVADEISTCDPHAPPVSVVSFGGPKVGNRAFAERLEKERKVNVLRIVNEGDVITKVPGIPRPHHVRDGYEHVGVELRIDSRVSPCLRSDAGPACCHDLEAYLHLVDGFSGTGLPFRSNASRSIVRLLRHQRTSVKEVYVNRAQALGVDPAAALNRSDSYRCLPSPSSS